MHVAIKKSRFQYYVGFALCMNDRSSSSYGLHSLTTDSTFALK